MVINVSGSKGKKRGAASPEQQLSHHEEHDRHHVAAGPFDAVVWLPILDAVVRAEGHAFGKVWWENEVLIINLKNITWRNKFGQARSK